MCIRSVDVCRLVSVGTAAAVATLVSLGFAGAQGYPNKFEGTSNNDIFVG